MKIYIIGCTGSGKTTFAKHLSKRYNIPYYELDNVVFDDVNHRKRTESEIKELFDNILKEDSWIIEDVGRKIFEKGREESDQIYFLKLKKSELYFRVIRRYIRQVTNKEPYNYKPTLKGLKQMLSWTKNYDTEGKLKELETYKEKVKIIKKKEIRKDEKE